VDTRIPGVNASAERRDIRSAPPKELAMIDISGSAIEKVSREFSSDGRESCVRIVLAGRGSGGPVFELEQSAERREDEIRREPSLTLVADRRLIEEFGGIAIEYVESHWGGGNLAIRPLVDLSTGSCGDCRC
jgi:Fe-S cluster assembly iron-binding protein IscA